MSLVTQIPSGRAEKRPRDSLWGAASEVLSAGQQVVLDRIDLLRAEIAGDAERLGTAAAMMAGASAFGLLGWIALSVAGALCLNRWLPADASVAVIGALNLAIGAVATTLGLRRIHAPSALSTPIPEPEGDGHA